MPDAILTAPASNSPPLVETARMAIEEQLAALQPRKAELLAALGRAKCTNPEEAGKCADLTKQIKKLAQKADGIRKDVKEPYLEAGKGVDAAGNAFKGELDQAERKLRDMLADFDRAERAKLAAEERRLEAERRAERERIAAAEAADREAARAAGVEAAPTVHYPLPEHLEPAPEPARRAEPAPIAAGDYGGAAHRRKVTTLEVTDPYALPLDVLGAPAVTEAILKVVRAMRQGNPDIQIHGIKVTEDYAVTIR